MQPFKTFRDAALLAGMDMPKVRIMALANKGTSLAKVAASYYQPPTMDGPGVSKQFAYAVNALKSTSEPFMRHVAKVLDAPFDEVWADHCNKKESSNVPD